MIQLFVEGNAVDINESFSTVLNFAIDDIRDFGAKNTSFSKTIILPGTKNNNVLFGNIFNISEANDYSSSSPNIGMNFNAAISARAVIFADNIQVFKGIFRIMEIIVDDGQIEYECAVFGELGGLILAFGNKKIEELDFSAYNHYWTISNIKDSWTNTGVNNSGAAGSGYVYPLIDYGNVSSNKIDYDVKAYRPALHVREYIYKMVNNAGYSLSSALMDTAMFKRLIINNNQLFLSMYNTIAFNGDLDQISYTEGDPYLALKISSPSVSGSFSANVDKTVFTYTSGTSTQCSISLTVFGRVVSGVTNGYIKLNKNGVAIGSYYVGTGGGGGFFTATISIGSITFNNLDTFSISFESTTFPFTVEVSDNRGVSNITITNVSSQLTPINYTEFIDVNATIPKGILQKDFLSSVLKMFNAYVVENSEYDKKITITPFVDFYTGDAINWSSKIDRAKPMKIKPMSELNSRYYQFKYKQDNDYYAENYRKKYNTGYGDYIFDSQYEFAKETTSVELIFAQSILVKYPGNDKVVPVIYKLSNNNTAEDSMDSVIRIMQYKKITGVTSHNIKNGATTISTETSYCFAGHVDDPSASTFDLAFSAPYEIKFTSTYTSNSLFNVYWSPYMAEITDKDSRLLTCSVKLDYKDLYALDFSKYVYIDGVLYRINKIIDYNVTKKDTCTVELLKVINKEY